MIMEKDVRDMGTYLGQNIYEAPEEVTITLECIYCAFSHSIMWELHHFPSDFAKHVNKSDRK